MYFVWHGLILNRFGKLYRFGNVSRLRGFCSTAQHDDKHVTSNSGFLIICGKNGIESAMSKYHRLAKEVGLVGKFAPHSLRYAYVVDKIIELRDAGCNRKEATSLAANFLGHGESRGRYISQVYGKTVVHTLPVETRKSRLDRAKDKIEQMISAHAISFDL
jgi:hypothetical protein